MASELLVATRSADKLDEIRAITHAVSITFVTLADLGVAPSPEEDAIESFPTFVENAMAKARHFATLTGMRTLADDSGLSVAALDGAPGVRSKRFALDHASIDQSTSGTALDRANNDLLLAKLVQSDDRRAHYVSAVALFDGTRTITALGTVPGEIAREPRGEGGFGYDPLFHLPALGRTFAEISRAQKNRISHRAVAMRAIAAHLR